LRATPSRHAARARGLELGDHALGEPLLAAEAHHASWPRLGAKPKLMTYPGSVNGTVFVQFVRTRLVPWLRPGDVVVMDNLNIHKMRAVRSAIEAAGAIPVYLPTYSPELNPIELLWADLKRSLRTLTITDEVQLRRAVRRLRRRVPTRKIAGWFGHALAHTRIK
jgi:transposase